MLRSATFTVWHLTGSGGWERGEEGLATPVGCLKTCYFFEKPSGRSLKPDRWLRDKWETPDKAALAAALAEHGRCPEEL